VWGCGVDLAMLGYRNTFACMCATALVTVAALGPGSPLDHAASFDDLVRKRVRPAKLTVPASCPPGIAPALHQHVEDFALVVDSTPKIQPLPGDAHDHLVQMPPVTRPRAMLAQPLRNQRAKLQNPTPHRLIGHVEPALGEKLLHIAVAQGEAEIQPRSRAG
jgi:hypothetical protein